MSCGRAGRASVRIGAALVALVVVASDARADRAAARVTFLDDGDAIARDASRAAPASPWPAGEIDLFALRGETIALQVVIEARSEPVKDARAIFAPMARDGDGAPLDARVESFVERFVPILRPSGNDRDDGSLAFTAKAAPPASAFLGARADPLVPVALERLDVAPHERGAAWIDVTIPPAAKPGLYRGAILVRDARRELAARAVALRVIDADLPYAATRAFVYYDTRELVRRMGDARAEPQLRALLHAHHLGAIHDLDGASLEDPAMLARDRAAIDGSGYEVAAGYEGPGEGIGEGVLALGAYEGLGPPTPAARDVAARLASILLGGPARARDTATFLYAVDEDCASPWPAAWVALIRGVANLDGVRVGATCGDEPSTQPQGLVMQTTWDLDPARARRARDAAGKWVWAYNGRRPYAGPMMLDVPATDLRANAWIAMRYGVPRWFYWEATHWFDDGAGGRGGARGVDPFTVAETFHNADGDHANGDGVLVYPGTQRAPGSVDYAIAAVFPSIRLENLRRGIEDAGYVALARAIDRERADAIVRRMIPRALAYAGDRASWPQRARPWRDARRELAAIIASSAAHDDGDGARVSDGCAIASYGVRASSARARLALFWMGAMVLFARRRARRRRIQRTNDQLSQA